MRFWQKIFLISLAVLTVAVNTIAYLLNILKEKLPEIYAAVRRALDELQLRAGLTADHLPGKDVAVVLHHRDDHLVAGLQGGLSPVRG